MKWFFSLIAFTMILAACGPGVSQQDAPPATNVPPTQPPTADIVPPTPTQETLSAPAVQQNAPEAVNRPVWQTLPLVNARTGETFTFADFAGQTVFIEPMATWCTNCRQQLDNVRSAKGQVDGQKVVFVALSVETNVTSETLAQYADTNNFDWTFAVITPELLGELVNVFGRSITSPPSTPHFIIRPDGTTTDLVTGIESSEQIAGQVRAASEG